MIERSSSFEESCLLSQFAEQFRRKHGVNERCLDNTLSMRRVEVNQLLLLLLLEFVLLARTPPVVFAFLS